MRKVFLLVMMCLLLVLSISCKSKNERILEKMEKSTPSEMVHMRNLIKRYCMDMSDISENFSENSGKCIKIISDTETEYNEKFLSLLDFYKDSKMSMEEIQELYNDNESKKLNEEKKRVINLASNWENTDKERSILALFMIDLLEEPGIYSSKIDEIKKTDDLEWLRNITLELLIRSNVIMKRVEIPEFSDPEVQKYAEKFLEYDETSRIYIIYDEHERLIDYNKKSTKKIYNDLRSLFSNISDEDTEKLIDYMNERRKGSSEIIEEQKKKNEI